MSAFVQLLFGSAKTTIGSLEMDATIEEKHRITATITQSPVERSTNISDHKIIQPQELVITGIISNTPAQLFSLGDVDPRKKADVVAWDTLEELCKTQELVEVQTSLRLYQNMAVVDVQAPRDAMHQNALEFTVTLKEVIIVDAINAPLVQKSKLPAGQKATNSKGTVAPKEVDAQKQSALKASLNALKTLMRGAR